MSEPINLLVLDLSHYDPAQNYQAVKESGIVGIIFKATQGTGYRDPTYNQQRSAAKAMGLLWGAYHFAEATSVSGQAENFCEYAQITDEDLFCLDWEDYGENTMSSANAKKWVQQVEDYFGRPGQCVLYSGNTAKEALGDKVDTFWSQRRLWVAQYGPTPKVQASWAKTGYYLWQYSEEGTVSGIEGKVDLNSYKGSAADLCQTWAAGEPYEPPKGDLVCPHCGTSLTVTLSEA